MLLRHATLEDFPALRALNAQASQPDNLPDLILKSMRLWIAEDGSELQGYVHALQIGNEVEIVQITVAPKYQRQGIGSLLLQNLKTEVPGASFHLEVASRNESAIAFYRKLGFEIVGTRKKYYASGEDAFRMRT